MGKMRWGGLGDDPAGRPLLPPAFRIPAAVLLTACVLVTVVLGLRFAGQPHGGGLDSVVDPRVRSALSRFPALLNFLADTGQLIPVTAMTLALVLACAVTRRWPGAVLAAVAVPAATVLTEWVLKPAFGRTVNGALSFPSGHATCMFALAGSYAVLLADPPGRLRPVVRLLPVLLALLAATAVAVAMVALGAHYFTDVVAGTAVGIGMVLACAFAMDAVNRRWRRAPTVPC